MARVEGAERERRVREIAELLDLDALPGAQAAQLSGGQRQRVAMGRAIVREPAVFLMDEPLSNLDAKLRVQMRAEIAALQARLGVTTVYVTHDQVEAMTMGHRVAVLRDGRLQQCDTPRAALRPPGERLRRRLHRLAGHEPLHAGGGRRARRAGRARARAARAASNGAAARSSSACGPSRSSSPATASPGARRGRRGAGRRRLRVLHGGAARRRGAARRPRRRRATRRRSATAVSLRPRLEEAHLFDPASGERLGE